MSENMNAAASAAAGTSASTDARTLVFEIGTEEIPASPLYAATEKLAGQAADALDAARIAHGEVSTCSTPRRILLTVKDVAATSAELCQESRGPAAAIAFDEAGNPTKAAVGFARGKGVDPADLVRRADESGAEYVYATVHEPARPTTELLPELLAGLVAGMSWPKSQRWGSGHVTFSRPIRWLLCLLGDAVVPVEYAGLVAGRTTRGHRFMANRAFEVADADALAGTYPEMKVVPSAAERERVIREQIAAIEAETGLSADTPAGTFAEVVNLVEWPTALLCHFDEEFLQVPPEIICDAMLEHQRYFPMYRADGSLDNAFIVVSNGDPAYNATIAEGNERVVRARLADAKFFVDEDERVPLESYVDKLANVVFTEKLGSVKDKTARIEKLAAAICEQAGLDESSAQAAQRAAHLCKADLVCQAVVEFTSLQGVMGGHYALASGEGEEVAHAITDHYRPRFAGDELPRETPGKVVAVADKLDTICGIFAAGDAPTGSSDPFALRRAAIGIVNILLDGPEVELSRLVDVALAGYAGVVDFDAAEVAAQVRAFFTTRLEVIAKDRGLTADCVRAVTAIGLFEPAEAMARIEALVRAREDDPETFDDLAAAYTRAANLADVKLGAEPDEALMGEPERALFTAIDAAQVAVAAALAAHDHAGAISALAALRAPIDAFFTDVLVMDDDEALRTMRLQLLNRFTAIFADVAAIGELAKKR